MLVRGETPSNQPAEQVFPSIPASVGTCRDVPTPPSDSPPVAVGVAVERLEQAGLGLMLAVINAAKIREGNHTF